ncbi:hypothetical protein K503DRAFT_358221 [Rhizopogon vinicolor AM-OR11-026]|uniref:Uncharacterized protein n=1 Tax=Rhizopogon vinicolor AM-OR11-026 TaxID=1314800 RepID=A0A1B7MSQ5_9AGAM|nr:hypothetical protein K503DRAFT_358221 [Rhizopogon vinicolor AM-OR11-026]
MSVRRQLDVVQLLITVHGALSTRVIHTLPVTTLSHSSPHLPTPPVISGLKRRCEEGEENQVERPRPSQGGDRITEAYLRSLQDRESM